jgi:hypothetical protein
VYQKIRIVKINERFNPEAIAVGLFEKTKKLGQKHRNLPAEIRDAISSALKRPEFLLNKGCYIIDII